MGKRRFWDLRGRFLNFLLFGWARASDFHFAISGFESSRPSRSSQPACRPGHGMRRQSCTRMRSNPSRNKAALHVPWQSHSETKGVRPPCIRTAWLSRSNPVKGLKPAANRAAWVKLFVHGFRKREDEFNARIMTANLEVADKLCCECVYQSHSQAFA